MRLALTLLFAVACVESSAVPCGTGVCSGFTVCGPQQQCVLQSQVDACVGKTDSDGCSYPTVDEGVCAAAVCVPAGCGNGVVELMAGEACDDGNRISFDGCSADCTSGERCGDAIIDRALGEDCDCGDGTATRAGCTGPNSATPGSTCREDCTLGRCGDSILDPAEACDDGNVLAGDGCRADCAGRWTMMSSGTFLDLLDVWGTSPSNVYAGGDKRLLHFDGLAWSNVTPPALQNSVVFRIAGSGPNDVHVATVVNMLLHFDGTTWSEFAAPAGTSLQALWIGSPTNGWAAGVNGSNQVLLQWDGVTWNTRTAVGWTELTGSDDLIPTWDISAVPNGSTALLVGQTGGVLECSATACTVLPTDTEQVLRGVWTIDPTHAFIVGAHGTILY